MADMNISLGNVKTFKTVNIEGVGVFKVRKLGSGEELDLSQQSRNLTKLLTELNGMNIGDIDLKTKEGREELKKKDARISKITDEINRIKALELDTYKRCFEDENEGKDVDKLIKLLTDEERIELFRQIFDPPKIIETPASVETNVDSDKGSTDE